MQCPNAEKRELTMLRKVLGWLCVIIGFLSTPGISAGGQDMFPGKWWRVPRVSSTLNLNEEQKARLDDLFFHNRRKLLAHKRTLEEQRAELDALLVMEPLDEDAIFSKLRQLEATRSELAAERFEFILQVRKILGAQGFQQLKSHFQENWERRDSVPPVRPGPRRPRTPIQLESEKEK
jgi:Spy/CpxP family protein refolding chaperone